VLCRTNSGDLQASITEGKNKAASLDTAVLEAIAKKEQTEQDLKKHQEGRAEAKEAMAAATALREKQAAAFAKEKSELDTNIAALTKAIAAIEKGMVGGFLQSGAANILRTYFMEKAEMSDDSRQELLVFLSGTHSSGYVPQSGEITGILKQIKDDMSKSLSEATSTEESQIKDYESLMSAKKKEVEALSAQIEEEMTRIGDLGVEIAGMKNDLENTSEALEADGDFLAELKAGCDKKADEWEEIKKTRAEELLALAEVIKVLNDDDALELFKKTLPSAGASSSLVQVVSRTDSLRAKALRLIRDVRQTRGVSRQELDLIALALSGQKIGFDKVIKMIDNMVANLKQEQIDDDKKKKEYCDAQMDESDDKKKSLTKSISDSELAIEDLEASIATLKDEIKALQAGIKALDKSVAEATEQRRAEHEDYKELMASDAAAKDILAWAKNRLNKFYNKSLYKPAPKRELEEQPPAALVQVSSHHTNKGAPPPPPETFDGYNKKTEETAGVMAMIDLLIKDLDKEMTDADVTEKDAQKEYEKLMADAAAKRADDTKSITTKTTNKASERKRFSQRRTARQRLASS